MQSDNKTIRSVADAAAKIMAGIQPEAKTEQLQEGWDDMLKSVKDKQGPQPSGGSGVKQGTRYGGGRQKDEPEAEEKPKAKKKTKGAFSEMVNLYQEKGLKSLEEAWGKKKKVMKEEPDNEQYTAELEKQKKKAAGTASEEDKAKVAAPASQGCVEVKEEVEAESLIESIEAINEVSLGAKIKAYAHHSSSSFDHGDMGNDAEAEHHQARADKIHAHILKHHGTEAAAHAEKAASAAIFGNGKSKSHGDSLSGGLRGMHSKSVTKSGKIPKNTQSAMKNSAKGSYGARVVGPKGHLPEEVETVEEELKGNQHKIDKNKNNKIDAHDFKLLRKEESEELDERTLTADEMSKREDIVKGMKKGIAGFKERYGDRAKEVMYATATKQAKKG